MNDIGNILILIFIVINTPIYRLSLDTILMLVIKIGYCHIFS